VLRIPYALNILILAPVLVSLLGASNSPDVAVFEFKVVESPGLRVLVAALWSAILLCSAAGLVWPERFVAILVLQVVYKALYLGIFVAPLLLRGGVASVPIGLSLCFLAIVLVWPVFILAAWGSRE
jgi:hypothetical protein